MLKRTQSLTVAIALVGASLTMSPTVNAQSSDSSASVPAVTSDNADGQKLSDRENQLFDALVLGQGELASELGIAAPEDLDATATSEAKAEFLRNYGPEAKAALSKIDSGDVNKTEQGMDELHQLLVDFSGEGSEDSENNSGEDNTVEPMVCTPVTGCALPVYLYAALAVHNTVAVTAFAGVVVGAWKEAAITNGTQAAQGAGAVLNPATTTDDKERLVGAVTRAVNDN